MNCTLLAEKGVDAWIDKDKKKSARTTAPNHQSGSSIAKNNNVISGQTLTDIIIDVKTIFNPDVKEHERDVFYQEEIPSEELGLDKNLSESILREGIRNSKKRKIKGAFMSAENYKII